MDKIKNSKFSFFKSFIKGEVSLGFWSYVKKGISLANSFLVIRALTIYQYGVYNLLLSAYAFVSDFFHNLFSAVVSNDLIRLIGEGREDKAKKLFCEFALFRMVMGAMPALAVFFLAPRFSEIVSFLALKISAFLPFVNSDFSLDYGPEVVVWIRLLGGLFLVDAVMLLAILLLKLRLRFGAFAVQPTLQKIAQFLLLAGFYFFGDLGLREIFIAQISAPLISLAILAKPVIQSLNVWKGVKAYPGRMLIPIIRTYGKWEVPQFLISDVNGRIRPWLIKAFIGTEAVGIFGVASTFVSALKDILPIRTLSILVPRKIKDRNYFNQLFIYGTKYYVLMSLALVVAGVAGVPVAINLFFSKFNDSIPLFFALLATIPIFAFTKVINVLLVAERRQKFVFFQLFLQNSLNLVFLFFFLPAFGIWGLPAAEIGANFLTVGIKYWYLVKTKFIGLFPASKLFSIDEQDRRALSILKQSAFNFAKKWRIVKPKS